MDWGAPEKPGGPKEAAVEGLTRFVAWGFASRPEDSGCLRSGDTLSTADTWIELPKRSSLFPLGNLCELARKTKHEFDAIHRMFRCAYIKVSVIVWPSTWQPSGVLPMVMFCVAVIAPFVAVTTKAPSSSYPQT